MVNLLTCICGGLLSGCRFGVSFGANIGRAVRISKSLALLGGVWSNGGIVFYFVLYATGAQAPAVNGTDRAQQRRGIILGVIATVITGLLVGMPNAVWERLAQLASDQTCHNVLQNRNSISLRVSIDLRLKHDQLLS